MQMMTKSHRARLAIREFKTITDAMTIRGFYHPAGKFGRALEGCLRDLSPEIYGSMNDPRVVELKGLEYVIDRLPQGIEEVTKLILTDEDQFEGASYQEIEPLKRRRTSYRISQNEICCIISRGITEVYDIITHMTFLFSEAKKIHRRLLDDHGQPRVEWAELETVVKAKKELTPGQLDSAIWNLSIILGRPYHETRQSYEYFEKNRKENKSNNGIFSLIYHLAQGQHQVATLNEGLVIYFTPSLMKIIGDHKYGRAWGANIKAQMDQLGFQDRPVHIISANLHSVVNLVYAWAAVEGNPKQKKMKNLYEFCRKIREHRDQILAFAQDHGFYHLPDTAGTNIDCQLIDTQKLEGIAVHPELSIQIPSAGEKSPVILVMDYAFGAQAFELMEQLLKPSETQGTKHKLNLGSVSIMGKAGILPGKKGDIMLATAHVMEGTTDNYIVGNDLDANNFDDDIDVYTGPMATVLGTSLQNRDVLEMFQKDWNAVGLEMEGGHYQKAINAAIIKGNIPRETVTRYAYYASDNPLMTGNTLAAGAMGEEGIKPTYMITKVILEKILGIQAQW